MIILRMAWANLFHNTWRTIVTVIILAAVLTGLIIFKSYTAFIAEATAQAVVAAVSNIRIARLDYWQDGDEPLMSAEEMQKIESLLTNDSRVSSIDPVLDFYGLIGNAEKALVFSAVSHDNPENYYAIDEGRAISANDTAIAIDMAAAKKLNLSLEDEEPYINLMTSSEGAMSMADFEVVGLVDMSAYRSEDTSMVVMSRAAALEFLGIEDGAHYVQVFLHNRSDTERVQKELSEALGENFYIMNWRELVPNYDKIISEYEIRYRAVSLILFVLIFFALLIALSAAFNERLNEYGTLEAIGLKKRGLICLLSGEAVFLSLLGLAVGLCVSGIATGLLSKTLKAQVIIPGSLSQITYFSVSAPTIVSVSAFICAVCLIAIVFPVSGILRSCAAQLMRRP